MCVVIALNIDKGGHKGQQIPVAVWTYPLPNSLPVILRFGRTQKASKADWSSKPNGTTTRLCLEITQDHVVGIAPQTSHARRGHNHCWNSLPCRQHGGPGLPNMVLGGGGLAVAQLPDPSWTRQVLPWDPTSGPSAGGSVVVPLPDSFWCGT